MLQARSSKEKKPSSTTPTKEFRNTNWSSISKGFVSLITVLDLKIFQFSGDIESNPGSTSAIEKVIFGSFHLGDARFGSTANIQCACNSLFALFLSSEEGIQVKYS